MTEFWAFWGEHWFLAWSALWLCWAPVALLNILITRTIRMVTVLFRGWPPEHLDADGDWEKQK